MFFRINIKGTTLAFGIMAGALLIAKAHDHQHTVADTDNKLSFIENKGQWDAAARYKAVLPDGVVFITDQGFVYNFVSREDIEKIHDLVDAREKSSFNTGETNQMIRHHAYRVNFSGANNRVRYHTEKQRSYYHNYFIGNDSAKWAGHVGLFEKIVQKNIYDGIDVALYSEGPALKYDFIVAPGADPGQIVLSFEGAIPELTKEGCLKISTTVNEVVEKAPYTYQVIAGEVIPVRCSYKLKNRKVTFDLPDGYNINYTLIIDPTLVFATYSGSNGISDLAFSSTHDKSGNMYTGAYCAEPGWPVTVGAFQTTPYGIVTVGINKFSPLGTALVYSTFYGGRGIDFIHSMICNESEELIIAGSTNSYSLPVTSGCYDSTLNGFDDIYIAHFNKSGSGLLGATYIGGSYSEAINPAFISGPLTTLDVVLDDNGNIWVAGHTGSPDFPVTANAFQSSSAGSPDAVIFQITPDCSQLLYSSYLGGMGIDYCFSIAINHDGNVVVCGGTRSVNFPVTPNVLHNTFQGGETDGFICIINTQTGRLMQSSYLGTDKIDYAYKLQVDENNNNIVLGHTTGNYPISPGVYHHSRELNRCVPYGYSHVLAHGCIFIPHVYFF